MATGYREACTAAQKRLEEAARSHADDEAAFRRDLLNIARTTLSSKILTHDKEHFARLAVDAVLRLRGSGNLEAVHIIKKPGGTLKVGIYYQHLSFCRAYTMKERVSGLRSMGK